MLPRGQYLFVFFVRGGLDGPANAARLHVDGQNAPDLLMPGGVGQPICRRVRSRCSM